MKSYGCIIKLLGHCKGDNLNVVRLFHRLNRGNKVFPIIGRELISCNVRAFHENPDRIYTELTFIIP